MTRTATISLNCKVFSLSIFVSKYWFAGTYVFICEVQRLKFVKNKPEKIIYGIYGIDKHQL